MTRYAMYLKEDSGNKLMGHIHKPNSSMELMNVMVSINSDGFRDKEYSVSRNGKYRIIVLGDSLTFGWGVNHEDTFENLLEEELNKKFPTEIINFGTGNYNTEQEVNIFVEKGLKYKPDKVILFYFINDAEITPKKSKLWFLGYSEFVSFYWSRINSLLGNYSPSANFKDYYSSLYGEEASGWLNAKKAMLELQDICEKNNMELQVVLLPELHDVDNQIFREVYEKVSLFLVENEINYINLADLFKDQENAIELWVSYDDAHPNKLAHKKIGESLIDFISAGEKE
jgi:lysophospholipase L1-like esterase